MVNAALRKHIGKHLQKARKDAGFKSARSFAESAGLEPTTYTAYEQGARAFNIEQAWEFAEALGVGIDELVGHEATREYADPRQEQMNGCYETLNEESKEIIAGVVASFAADADRRTVKDAPWLESDEEPMEGVA